MRNGGHVTSTITSTVPTWLPARLLPATPANPDRKTKTGLDVSQSAYRRFMRGVDFDGLSKTHARCNLSETWLRSIWLSRAALTCPSIGVSGIGAAISKIGD
jgi:hypothetical protein